MTCPTPSAARPPRGDVEEYKNAKKNGTLSKDIQTGTRETVSVSPEELEERRAIQEEQTASEIGDFLDELIEKEETPPAPKKQSDL